MDLFDWGGRAFRSRLKRELPQWRAEGLVDEATAANLHDRYELGEEGAPVAAAAIFTLGALLIGGGIISFVAWNWEDLPRAAKLAILGFTLLAAHGIGYWLWHVDGRLPRLGHALVLLGTLIFGANIGLIAQIFHISSEPSRGVGAWAVGAAAAGWALLSVPNAALAVVLTAIWGLMFVDAREQWFFLPPYAVALPFLPLAWLQRSRPLFAAVAVATAVTMVWSALIETGEGGAFVATALATGGLLLALPFFWRTGTTGWSFRGIATAFGMLAAVGTTYFCSFHEIAEEISFHEMKDEGWTWLAFALPALLGGVACCAVGVATQPASLRSRPASVAAFLGVVLLWLCLIMNRDGVATAVVANVVLAAVAITAITSAVRHLERRAFWNGSLLAGLVILSRFLEFDTELWLKAIVFTACGIAVIVFGLSFERRRRAATGAGRA